MLFIVGIEYLKSEGKNFGIIVLVFECIGYGCLLSVSSVDLIVINVKDVILIMVEEVVMDGYLILVIEIGFEELDVL